MEIICITINENSIFVCKKDIEEKKETVLQVRRMSLPTALTGSAQKEKPEELAKFITEYLTMAKVEGQRVALYIGSGIESFAEYKYSDAPNVQAKRITTETYSLLGANASNYFVENYNYDGGTDLKIAALIAAPGDFCKKAAKVFKSAGYELVQISSALLAYLERMKPFLENPLPALAIDVDEESLKLVYRPLSGVEHAGLVSLENPPVEDIEAIANTVDMAKGYVTDGMKLVLSGSLSKNPLLAGALDRLGDILLEKTDASEIRERYDMSASGEMEGKEAYFPVLFASMGEPPGSKLPNYLMGGSNNRKSLKTAKLLVAGLAATVVIACSVPLIHLVAMKSNMGSNTAVLAEEENAALKEKLAENRQLVTALEEFEERDQYLPAFNDSRVELLKEIRAELLEGADVTEMFAEESGTISMEVEMNESDIASFDSRKSKINDEMKISVLEQGSRAELPDGRVSINLKVERL
ncbi:MAG: hypothetical protein LBK04_06175 [Clostridiales Family XIII bacterium]|jgi:hypothetical protein|nr:hypothetical protein [Clostridiales Family XIII bacterium]